MKRAAWCLLAMHAFLMPCFSDVIPTRRVERNEAAERAVKARLERLGVGADEADRHVGALTPGETDYFARNPERIQNAGALEWDEWVLGIGAFFFFAGLNYWFLA